MISYYLHKFGGWLMFVVVIIIFLIGLQVVQRAKQGLGLAPPPPAVQPATTPQAGTAAAQGPSTANAAAPTTTNTNSPRAPVVPAGPTPADIRATLQDARDRLVESGVHVDAALKSISAWKAEIPPLMKTAAGNNIAAREDLVARLTTIVNTKRTSEDDLRDAAKRAGTMAAAPSRGQLRESAIAEAVTAARGAEARITELGVSRYLGEPARLPGITL